MAGPYNRGAISQALSGVVKTQKAVALKNLKDAAELVQADMRILVNNPGPGHSAPGQPPRRQSGRLWKGIVVKVDPARMTATVESTAPYSAALEKGSRRVAPRPFMSVSWERTKARRLAIMQRRK